MGLTQQKHAVATLQTLINWMLLGGYLGRPGAGLCPVRGHSNVQGDRTMGITVNPRPGPGYTEAALRKLRLTVQISTKLNRSHLVTGRDALILPCLGRTDRDLQAAGPQSVTVEDSMSRGHASRGHRRPFSPHLHSEPAIVAGIAKATLGGNGRGPDWDALIADYDRIRDRISAVLPACADYNRKLRQPGGFYLGNSAQERRWETPTGKAQFLVHPLPDSQPAPGQLRLATFRSHDQYNTTIYGLDDRYRGIRGRRRVVFLHPEDMHARGLAAGARVDLIGTVAADGAPRRTEGFEVVPYDLPRGCASAYFPETNVLIPIDSYADCSLTPTSKLILIRLRPAGR